MPETIGLHLISVTVGRRHLSLENQTLPSFPASTEGRIRHGHPSAKENSAVQKKSRQIHSPSCISFSTGYSKEL